MYDIATAPPTENDIRLFCERFDAWGKRWHTTRQTTYYSASLEQDLALARQETDWLPWHACCFRLMRLALIYGREGLDTWWGQEGKRLYWDTEKRCPRSPLHPLLFYTSQGRSFPKLCVTEWALQEGWSPECRDGSAENITPLHAWILNKFPGGIGNGQYLSVLERLLTPVTVNARTAQGHTPLSFLMTRSHGILDIEGELAMARTVCRTLLALGADVHLADRQGMTPLHLAVSRGTYDINYALAALLLENGADVHYADLHGMTPLHLVALRGTQDIKGAFTTLLLEKGANPLKPNKAGSTAFDLLDAEERPFNTKEIASLRECLNAAVRQQTAETLTAGLSEKTTPLQKRIRL